MMIYPDISVSKCGELARQLQEGFRPAIEDAADWLGTGDTIDLKPLESLGAGLSEEMLRWTDPDRDRLEGYASGRLYDAVAHVPFHIRDARGFWRYLALRYFWDFIAWREEKPFRDDNYLKYVDATANSESVLTRMYLRARALGGSSCDDLAGGIQKGTDFWRSHIIRVRAGSAVPIATAFAERQRSTRLTTDPLRATAKRLTRTWTNVVLYLYDQAEADELIDEIWPNEDGL